MQLPYISSIRGTVAALLLAVATPLIQAQTYIEVGDAGQTPGTAQATGLTQSGAGALTIIGSIGGANDADVFRINLTSPAAFSATTMNAITMASGGLGGLDTQLFLFDSLFRPVFANDDATGTSLQSTLPAGTSFTLSLAPGVYYIAISLSGNNPVNINNQLVFDTGLSTSLRGMASGLNPTSFSDFNSGATFAQSGAYAINISAVPEAGTTMVLGGLMCVALFALRKCWPVRATVRK